MLIRLQKYMADNGVASRRKSEELILSGAVAVNGAVVCEPGFKIDVEKDMVLVHGRVIKPMETGLVYYMLNKPKGYVSTAKDQFGRPAVVSLIKSETRLYPVGRLDYDTEGLLILTNDGEFTNRLTHPRHSVTKEYEAKVKGRISDEDVRAFQKGIDIGGYVTKPALMRLIKQHENNALISIVIKEGKNRQVRKMCGLLGHEVTQLKRVAIGGLKLGSLETGKYRKLTNDEVLGLLAISETEQV